MGEQAGSTDYRLRPRAEADLAEIWRYTAHRWSVGQADIYIEAILDAFERLASDPTRGRPTDIRSGYRRYAINAHFIFYRLSPDGPDIVRILHKRMNVDVHLDDPG